MEKNQLLQLISQNKFEEAFEILSQIDIKEHELNVFQNKARLTHLKNLEKLGTIKTEEKIIEENKIRFSLLETVYDLIRNKPEINQDKFKGYKKLLKVLTQYNVNWELRNKVYDFAWLTSFKTSLLDIIENESIYFSNYIYVNVTDLLFSLYTIETLSEQISEEQVNEILLQIDGSFDRAKLGLIIDLKLALGVYDKKEIEDMKKEIIHKSNNDSIEEDSYFLYIRSNLLGGFEKRKRKPNKKEFMGFASSKILKPRNRKFNKK